MKKVACEICEAGIWEEDTHECESCGQANLCEACATTCCQDANTEDYDPINDPDDPQYRPDEDEPEDPYTAQRYEYWDAPLGSDKREMPPGV